MCSFSDEQTDRSVEINNVIDATRKRCVLRVRSQSTVPSSPVFLEQLSLAPTKTRADEQLSVLLAESDLSPSNDAKNLIHQNHPYKRDTDAVCICRSSHKVIAVMYLCNKKMTRFSLQKFTKVENDYVILFLLFKPSVQNVLIMDSCF